jgi:hypothetical protein
MKRLLLTMVLGAAGLTGSLLLAAEPATKPEATGSAATAAAKDPKATQPATQAAKPDASKPEATKPEAKDAAAATKPGSIPSDEDAAPPPSAADKGPSPQRFTPSEQVRADFDVSFPIDI